MTIECHAGSPPADYDGCPRVHEETSVKTKSKTITGLPRHPFGIIRVAERHERICGCSHSHQRRRIAPCRTPGCNLSPALDLDVDPVEPCSRYFLADCVASFVRVELSMPEEAESGSASVQPDKEYPGRRCANGASGLWAETSSGATLFSHWTGPTRRHYRDNLGSVPSYRGRVRGTR